MEGDKDHQCNAGESSESNSFVNGLRILVVDDDPTCLEVVKKMLVRCKYEVTTCEEARFALSILRERKGGFDLVLTDVHLPDMDGFKLLERIGLELDLPVIMMSADKEIKIAMKGLEHGACYYLTKPICFEEMKNLWQHVVRKKKIKSKENVQANSNQENESNKTSEEEVEFTSSENEGSSRQQKRKKEAAQEDEDVCLEEDFEESIVQKKQRMIWDQDLHNEFLKAIDQLGFNRAVPKRILEIMNVPGLTRENVASHLQKYRMFLRRLNGNQPEPRLPRTSTSGSARRGFPPISPYTFSGFQDQMDHHHFMDNLTGLQPGSTVHMQNPNAPMPMPSVDQMQFLNQESNAMMSRLSYGTSMNCQGFPQGVNAFDPKQGHLLQTSDGNWSGSGLAPSQMRMDPTAHGIEAMQTINQPQQAVSGPFSSHPAENFTPDIRGCAELTIDLNSDIREASLPSPSHNFNTNYNGLQMTATGGQYEITQTGPIMAASNTIDLNNDIMDASNEGQAVIGCNLNDQPNPEVDRSNLGNANKDSSSFSGFLNTNQYPSRLDSPTQQENDFPTGDGNFTEMLKNSILGNSSNTPKLDEAHLDDLVLKQKDDELMDADLDISSFQLDDD